MMTDMAEKNSLAAEAPETDYWGESRKRFMEWRDEKHRRDALNEINEIMDEIQSAELRGEARGEERAIARGEARGITLGEERERLKIARVLLKENAPLDVIQRATGLSENDISSLR
jgi:predicted transposase/invertase (TIGR01784 family)